MSAVAEPQPLDFDAIEAEINGTIQRLEQARQRLALDALGGDEEIRAELLNVESELGAARGELARLDLARAETARRELEAQKESRRLAEDAAIHRARKLQVDREHAVRDIDRACGKFAEAVATYARVAQQQQIALAEAGVRPDLRSGARLLPIRIEGAVKHALREHRAPHALDLPPIPVAHVRPLKQTDPRIVDPLKDEGSK